MLPEPHDVSGNWHQYWNTCPPRAWIRLSLLNMELESLRFSFADFASCGRRALPWEESSTTDPDLGEARSRMFHHARMFVATMRRFGRVLEACKNAGNEYPPTVRDAIALAWRASRATVDLYTEPRNALEHIDGEVAGNLQFMNLWGDELQIAGGKRAPVTRKSLEVARAAWQRIAEAVCEPGDSAWLRLCRRALLVLLRRRAGTGTG